jgi:hypothetical protein
MWNEQQQIKQMQAMMGKYLTELSDLKDEVAKLKETVKVLEGLIMGDIVPLPLAKPTPIRGVGHNSVVDQYDKYREENNLP